MVERKCGDCRICCIVTEIKEGEFFKAAGTACLKLCSTGCSIWHEKPNTCTNYDCSWKRGFGNEWDRPDKNGVMLSVSEFNGGTWIFVMEIEPFAHIGKGKDIIVDIANQLDMPVIISLYTETYGKDFGDFVIIKEKLESRSSKIKGDFVCDYAEGLKQYKLTVN